MIYDDDAFEDHSCLRVEAWFRQLPGGSFRKLRRDATAEEVEAALLRDRGPRKRRVDYLTSDGEGLTLEGAAELLGWTVKKTGAFLREHKILRGDGSLHGLAGTFVMKADLGRVFKERPELLRKINGLPKKERPEDVRPSVVDQPVQRQHPKKVNPCDLFGRLVVLREGPKHPKNGRTWVCRCACGVEKTIRQDRLNRGETRSCGCLQRDNREAQAAEAEVARVRKMTAGLRAELDDYLHGRPPGARGKGR